MNLQALLYAWRRRRRGTLPRFPLGQANDPLLTMLPPHHEVVAVQSVVGSMGRYNELDRRFRPLHGRSARLQAITLAMKNGVTFPPIEVYRLHGECYINDGHHRVAAALEVGQLYLDA